MDLLFYIVLSAALVAGIITQLKWALEDLALPQHPDQHRSERPVLLAVDQELGEGAGGGVPEYAPMRSARSESGGIRSGVLLRLLRAMPIPPVCRLVRPREA